MNFDKRLMFCEEQAITSTAVESQNTIELGDNDVSIGTPVPLFMFVNEAFAGGTSLKIEIQVNDEADFSGTTKTLFEETIEVADLVANAVLAPKFMPKGAKGYARLKFTPTGTFTAGKITAGVVDAIHEDYTDL